MVTYMVADNKKNDIDINMEIQFGERVGHGGWLIGPKLFRPEAYPACASPLSFAKLLTKLSFPNPVLKFVPEGEGEKKTTFVRPTQLGFRFDFDSQKGPKGGKRLFEPKSPETEWN